MNDELQQALTSLINKSIEVSGDALAFTQQQLPEVIQQLLLFKLVSGYMWVLLGASLAVCGIRLLKYSLDIISKTKKEGNAHLREAYENDTEMAWIVFGALCLLVGGILFFSFVSEVVKIWLAPKVYLIEYAAEMVK